MTEKGFKRKLTAILSADVEVYIRLMDNEEEAIVRSLTAFHTAITDIKGYYNEHPTDQSICSTKCTARIGERRS